jgi:hypothetical protein
MTTPLAASALFAEIFARCGQSRPADDVQSFELSPRRDERVFVSYDSDDQVVWLTSVFEPVMDYAVDTVLQRLLMNNLLSIEDDMACSIEADSAAPILQSWLNQPLICIADFELALERHLDAASEIRKLLALPVQETREVVADELNRVVWG